MLPLLVGRCEEMLLLGAHCADIAIGAGGTVLQLCRANPGIRVTAAVLTGGGSLREEEERAALAAFCPGGQLEVVVLDLPNGRLPAHWDRAKHIVEELHRRFSPDVIFAPPGHDAHQDHRGLAEIVPTAFRDHLVLGYEILKWDGDLAQPTGYVPLPPAVLGQKVDLLREHYGSHQDRTWFDMEAFRALARIRGVQSRHRYAEAFHLAKLNLGIGRAEPLVGVDG